MASEMYLAMYTSVANNAKNNAPYLGLKQNNSAVLLVNFKVDLGGL